MNQPYCCYALMDNRGRWRAWQFAPATVDMQKRLITEVAAAGHVAFASVQTFAPSHDVSGITPWRQVKERYTAENALPHSAPLYFDIDADSDLDKALRWVRTLVEFFTEQLDLPESAVRLWFSGSKGAHVLVDATALGIEPSATLTVDMKAIALELVRHLNAQGVDLSVDKAVYSLPRMLRLPDQLNPKSGLFKVELHHHELFQWTTDQIIELARRPRGSLWTPDELSNQPVPTAVQWFSAALARAQEPRKFRIKTAQVAGIKVRPDGYVADELIDTNMPPCITEIIGTTVSPGSRNRCELQIACWAKAAQLPVNKALALLTTWTQQNRSDLSSQNAQIKAQSIVHSVYANASYGFSCVAALAAARALDIIPECNTCQAVQPRSFRQLFSLRVRHDAQWMSNPTIPLEEARGLIARNIDSRVITTNPHHPGHRPTGSRQDPRRPAIPGQPRHPGRLCGSDASVGHASAEESPEPRRDHALLASGTQR